MRGIIELIMMVVLALGALGALYALDKSRQRIGEDRKAHELLPKIAEAEKARDAAAAGRDTALAANKQLSADLGVLREEREACSRRVEWLEKRGARQREIVAVRKPADDKRLADIDVEKAELIAALGLGDKGGTCEEQLARSTALWSKIRAQRLRDFPPTNAPPKDDSAIIIKERK